MSEQSRSPDSLSTTAGRPASRTALKVAALRALHQTEERPPVFVDPLARRILGVRAAEMIADTGDPIETRRLRTALAIRSRLAEEAVAAAVARGVRQYVLLGAGLDTFAYRQTHASLTVFEVDHPGTQAWKLTCLARAQIAVPPSARHVAFDFEGADLVAALAAHGFAAAQPAVFAMLGVSFYVERRALLRTLAAVGRAAAGSEIVFDYVPAFDDAPEPSRSQYIRAAERVAAAGEPWITTFDPTRLPSELAALGFTQVEDLDADALTRRYLADRTDGLMTSPLAHIVVARVG